MAELLYSRAEMLMITPNAEALIEKAGRVCYKSEDRIKDDPCPLCQGSGRVWYDSLQDVFYPVDPFTPQNQKTETCPDCQGQGRIRSCGAFIKMLRDRGHYSVLEHATATFHWICDRGVTHELVRHRVASFSQESTRYCNYGKQEHVKFIIPDWVDIEPGVYKLGMDRCIRTQAENVYLNSVLQAEKAYNDLIHSGAKPQEARHVLPIGVKTEIVTTCNFREWLHIINLRTSSAAHPHIRYLAGETLRLLSKECPNVFN